MELLAMECMWALALELLKCPTQIWLFAPTISTIKQLMLSPVLTWGLMVTESPQPMPLRTSTMFQLILQQATLEHLLQLIIPTLSSCLADPWSPMTPLTINLVMAPMTSFGHLDILPTTRQCSTPLETMALQPSTSLWHHTTKWRTAMPLVPSLPS